MPERWEQRLSLAAERVPRLQEAAGKNGRISAVPERRVRVREVDRLHDRARARGQRRAGRLRERRVLLCGQAAGGLGAGAAGGRAARNGARPRRLRAGLERARPPTSFENATFAKAVVAAGDKRVRVFSMRTGAADIFGPHHVSFVCDPPEVGRYTVLDRGRPWARSGYRAACYERDRPAGRAVDLYAAARTVGEPASSGCSRWRRATTSCI
ncbi:MAG: hypothetical protein MZW92_41385 [Comamonadaceae bacterium]|nr:hypothetical protein [Comamonadaceae bacterium]